MSKSLKVLKNRFKKAKAHLAKSQFNHYKATKYGSDKQIALCKKRLEKSQERFNEISEKLQAAKKENPNLISRTVTKVKESPVKKVFSWTGLAVTAVVTAVVGTVIYEYVGSKDDEGIEAADTV